MPNNQNTMQISSAAEKFLTRLGRFGVGCGIISMIPYSCLYNVDAGERAVMFNRFGGISNKIHGEGTHFRIPWFQNPYIYSVRTKATSISTTTGTKDLQIVELTLRLLFRPRADKLVTLHKTLGPDFDNRVIPSITNEILKAVVARHDAENLLTKRDEVSKDVREAITERASQFDILLDDVAITHVAYGNEFSKAIEEKQVAQQDAERSKFMVMRAEQERRAVVIKAEGEAEAARMISKALKEHGSALIEVRRIDSMKEIVSTLCKSKNVMYIPSHSSFLLNSTATTSS